MLSAVHKLNREKGITVVLITHHMNEAEDADRVVVMDDGKVIMDGAPRQVFTQVERLRSMGLTVPATFMAVARQGLFFIPTVWILALTLGLPGIQMAQMVADLLTFLCSVPIQIWVLKKLSQPQK